MNELGKFAAAEAVTQIPAIQMQGITKIFGPRPQAALALLAKGQSKADVQAESGHVIGLNDVNDLQNSDKWKNQSIQLGVGFTF